MKGAIIKKGEIVLTRLRPIFERIDDFQKNYNWLISNCEAYPVNKEIEDKLKQYGEYAWITGEELTDIVYEEDFLWVWAVLSGFEKHISLEEVLKYKLPYADGYRGFWNKNISIQHPLATIELVAWDSVNTLFISKDNLLVEEFQKAFPFSMDLEQHNMLYM